MALPFPDLLDTDALLSDEERDIRETTRKLVDDLVRPRIADWFERAGMPVRELAEQFGAAGLLGMHLDGYGCAGTSATAYGLACWNSRPVTPASGRWSRWRHHCSS